MTEHDLEVGMIIERIDGGLSIVLPNTSTYKDSKLMWVSFDGEGGFDHSGVFESLLTETDAHGIKKIYGNTTSLGNGLKDSIVAREVIWERESEKDIPCFIIAKTYDGEFYNYVFNGDAINPKIRIFGSKQEAEKWIKEEGTNFTLKFEVNQVGWTP